MPRCCTTSGQEVERMERERACVSVGTVTRQCVSDDGVHWSQPDFSQCTDRRVVQLLDRVRLSLFYTGSALSN